MDGICAGFGVSNVDGFHGKVSACWKMVSDREPRALDVKGHQGPGSNGARDWLFEATSRLTVGR